jgi:chromosome segregation ATPase
MAPTLNPASITPMALTSSSDLNSVATRIQERAQQLSDQEFLLEEAKLELQKAHELSIQQDEQNRTTRQEFLSIQRERDGLELEMYKLQDSRKEMQAKTAKLEQNISILTQKTEQAKREWESSKEMVLAEHTSLQDLYMRHLGSQIQHIEDRKHRRAEKLRSLADTTEQAMQEEERMRQFTNQIKSQIDRYKGKENSENSEIQKLAVDVRAALAKVSKSCSPLFVVCSICFLTPFYAPVAFRTSQSTKGNE